MLQRSLRFSEVRGHTHLVEPQAWGPLKGRSTLAQWGYVSRPCRCQPQGPARLSCIPPTPWPWRVVHSTAM